MTECGQCQNPHNNGGTCPKCQTVNVMAGAPQTVQAPTPAVQPNPISTIDNDESDDGLGDDQNDSSNNVVSGYDTYFHNDECDEYLPLPSNNQVYLDQAAAADIWQDVFYESDSEHDEN